MNFVDDEGKDISSGRSGLHEVVKEWFVELEGMHGSRPCTDPTSREH